MSWAEFRDFLEWLPRHGESALFRALNPETWMWATVDTQLLAEIATSTSRHKFLTAMSLFEELIEDDYPARYGPQPDLPAVDEKPQPVNDDVDKARGIADELRRVAA